jgi:hypothetical protein
MLASLAFMKNICNFRFVICLFIIEEDPLIRFPMTNDKSKITNVFLFFLRLRPPSHLTESISADRPDAFQSEGKDYPVLIAETGIEGDILHINAATIE